MKKFALTLALLASFSGAAFAQAAAPVDPAASAAARKMLGAMNYRVTMVNAMAQMSRSMPAMMKGSMTNMIANDARLTDDQRKRAIADVEKAMPRAMEAVGKVLNDPAMIDEMVEEMVPLYARTYTVSELDQIATFYASPVGRKVLDTMPQMMAAGMEVGQRIVTPRLNKVMSELLKPGAK